MKNKTPVIIAIVIVIIIAGLAWYARPDKDVNQKIDADIISHEDASSGIRSSDEEDSSKTTSVNMLKATETFYDFGAISMKDGKVSKIFKISNESDFDIFVPSVYTSCMCTVAYVVDGDDKKGPFGMPGHGGAVPKVNETIKAGESRNIEVVFDPNAHGPAGIGMIDRFVFIEDANGEKLQLEIKATVTP